MARSESSQRTVEGYGAIPVHCSLTTLTKERFPNDVDIIIHSAACAKDWGPYEEYYESNVIGTKQLLQVANDVLLEPPAAAAAAAGESSSTTTPTISPDNNSNNNDTKTKKMGRKTMLFIHVGTEAVHFDDNDKTDLSNLCEETAPPLQFQSQFPYTSTKAHAEKLVTDANSSLLKTIVLRPRIVWGPGDTTILPTLLRIVEDGGFWWINHGQAKTSVCHIDNLTEAVHCCIRSFLQHTNDDDKDTTTPTTAATTSTTTTSSSTIPPKLEEICGHAYYIADDGTVTQKDFFTQYVSVSTGGRTALPNRSIPYYWVVMNVAWFLTKVWDWVGQPMRWMPPLTPMAIYILGNDITLQTTKAKTKLQWKPIITTKEGLHQLSLVASRTTTPTTPIAADDGTTTTKKKQ